MLPCFEGLSLQACEELGSGCCCIGHGACSHVNDDFILFACSIDSLSQAVEEIHQLKDAVYKEQGRVRDLVNQVSNLSRQVEDLSDENSVIRQKAGLPAGAKVDTKDVKMQKEATIAQLRSLNALLERQVSCLVCHSAVYAYIMICRPVRHSVANAYIISYRSKASGPLRFCVIM